MVKHPADYILFVSGASERDYTVAELRQQMSVKDLF